MSFGPVVSYVVFCDGPMCEAFVSEAQDPQLAQYLEEAQLPDEWTGPGRGPGDWLLTPLRHLCPACADAEGRDLLAGVSGTPTSEGPTP